MTFTSVVLEPNLQNKGVSCRFSGTQACDVTQVSVELLLPEGADTSRLDSSKHLESKRLLG